MGVHIAHSKRQEHAMLTKFDLHVFEQRFGSFLEGSFCFAASFIMPPSSLNSLVVSTQLVHWFFPIAHLGEVENSNKRLLDKGKAAICYGRFSTLEELAANESCCVVLTFSTLSFDTRDILVGCCDHGFYVIHSDSVLQDVPSSDEMFSDYSRELGGLFEKLLLIGGLFKAVLARRFTDWPGGPCGSEKVPKASVMMMMMMIKSVLLRLRQKKLLNHQEYFNPCSPTPFAHQRVRKIMGKKNLSVSTHHPSHRDTMYASMIHDVCI